jgi:hypothetical protein
MPVVVPKEVVEAYRNRKGFVSTNTLLACDWDLKITFIFPGVEGIAHDSTVLYFSNFLQNIPIGVYVLADAGYPLTDKILTPFRKVRYHLKEWGNCGVRPQNMKELFNLRHAKARNHVERTIGILKRRFAVLRKPMEYEMDTILSAIFACALLHNFIRIKEKEDLAEDLEKEDTVEKETEEDLLFDFADADNFRGWIASEMWKKYQEYRKNESSKSNENNNKKNS